MIRVFEQDTNIVRVISSSFFETIGTPGFEKLATAEFISPITYKSNRREISVKPDSAAPRGGPDSVNREEDRIPQLRVRRER